MFAIDRLLEQREILVWGEPPTAVNCCSWRGDFGYGSFSLAIMRCVCEGNGVLSAVGWASGSAKNFCVASPSCAILSVTDCSGSSKFWRAVVCLESSPDKHHSFLTLSPTSCNHFIAFFVAAMLLVRAPMLEEMQVGTLVLDLGTGCHTQFHLCSHVSLDI